MKILRKGSTGQNVKLLQSILLGRGYRISVDGDFGNGTKHVVIKFQNSRGLTADGIVGKSTWDVLLNKNKIIPPQINTTRYVLTTKNYFNEPQSKSSIVLHHTNGWTVRKGTIDKPSMNHFNWWTSQNVHVSTAFSVDYNGNIYKHFDAAAWAYHIGLGGAMNYLDKKSIAIELVNEGHMIKKNNKYYWMSDKKKIPYNRVQDRPVFINESWRGYNYFAPYSDKQVNSTLFLVKYLCDRYDISKNFIANNDYHPELLDGDFEGIYNHANVRKFPDGDKPIKYDLSPAFDFKQFEIKLLR